MKQLRYRLKKKTILLCQFTLFILLELIVSSVKVARDVITLRLKSKVGVIAVHLNSDTDLEITLLSNLISLTPGTLTLDVSTDKRTIFIHTVFADDIEGLRNTIKKRLEKPILGIMR